MNYGSEIQQIASSNREQLPSNLSSELTNAANNIETSEITILIKSNRSYVQGFNAMGSPYNGNDNANANQEYRYNFTGYIFNTTNGNLSIEVKGVGASEFSTVSAPFGGNNAQGVAEVLNTLGIGIFDTYTDTGQTYVSTHNDNNVFGDLTIFSETISVEQIIESESGDPLTSENGDIITTEVSQTTIFPVEYIPQGDPALTITIQDAGAGGGGGTTYSQVRNAFSQNNYDVKGLYLYSPDINQLSNVIQYNTIDASGSKNVFNITNVINPNQYVSSSLVDLSMFEGSVVFNGNSFISSTIAPFNELQIKFLSKSINTNSNLSNNFIEIEKATNTKFFEPQNDSLSVFEKNEAEIINAIPEEYIELNIIEKHKSNLKKEVQRQNESKKIKEKSEVDKLLNKEYTPLILLAIAASIAGVYFYYKKKR